MPIRIINGKIICSNLDCNKGNGIEKGLLEKHHAFRINFFASEIYCLECYDKLFPNPIPFSSKEAERIAGIVLNAQRKGLSIIIKTPESYEKFIKYFNSKPLLKNFINS